MTRKTFVVLILTVLAACCFGMANKDGVKNPPKNIIVMISDGCGYNHLEAASLYRYGKSKSPVYEQFPVSLAMSTYLSGGQYDPNQAWQSFGYFKSGATDSAAAATAMSTGIKTYNGAIGVDMQKKPVKNIIERCEELKMSTGVITSVEFSHATPAGFVAHNKNRGNYSEIAQEMINQSACEVIMGCGHPLYDGDGNSKNEGYDYVGGKDTFDALVAGSAGGDCDGDDVNDHWTLIQSRQDFQKLSSGQTPKRLLGVAQVHTTLQQARSGDNKADSFKVKMTDTVPTLSEMTSAAINVLDNNPGGFFLMIEGGAADWASHANQSGRVIEEQIAFEKAIETVIEWVNKNSTWDDTLLIVTSDHETGYITGPDSGKTKVWNPLVNNGPENMPGFEWHSGGHTNQFVPFFAKGSSAELFKERAINTDTIHGQYLDNTDIANTIFTLLKQR